MKTLIVDNFVSMVNTQKFMLGDITDYSVMDDATHNCKEKSLDVCTNKPVQPNFRGTDFPDALDTICIRLFRFNITFLPAGRCAGAYYH